MSFNSVKIKIAKKEGIPEKNAAAILAASSRKAVANGSKNKNLLRVKGKAKM